MSQLQHTQEQSNNVAVIEQPEKGKFDRFVSYGVATVGSVALAVPAYAVDFEPLKAEFTGLQTAVTGVIAIALSVTIAIVGWKWVKRVAFSV